MLIVSKLKMLCCIFTLIIGLSVPAYAVSQYVTPFDTIPNFAEFPTTVTVKDGNWEDSSTWSNGVPIGTSVVAISGYTVKYNSLNGVAKAIGVFQGGVLTFSTTTSTHLEVDTIQIVENSKLLIGSVSTPLPKQFKAELLIGGEILDTQRDPFQYGAALIVIDSTIEMLGESKLPAFVRLTKEPLKDETALTVLSPVTNWNINDKIVIPDTRQLSEANLNNFIPQWETVTVKSLNNLTINLEQPLQFSHLGAPNSLTSVIDYYPHAINTTRNIVIRSKNPTGVRGHVLLTRKSTINIQNTSFEQLGRTTTAPIDNTTFDANGKVLSVGKNQIGKYALHMHHIVGPYTLIGNVIHGGELEHKFKWHITIHDSHYGTVQNNVMYNCAGACLMTEQGNESSNIIENNFAIRATGNNDRMGMGSEATGFWFRGANNYIRNNVAANIVALGVGTQHCGYSIWQQYGGDVRIPKYSTSDTNNPSEYTLKSIYTIPILEFYNNEVYSSACGITAWWLGVEYRKPLATEDSIVEKFQAWNIMNAVWFNYHTHRLVINGWVTRGRNPEGLGCCNNVFQGLDYFASDLTIKNSDLQGYRGVVVSTDTLGTQLIKDTQIVALDSGVSIVTPWTSSGTPSLKPRNTVLDNVKILPIPGKKIVTLNFLFSAEPVRDLILSDKVTVKNYQQVLGANFNAYYTQQHPNFITPKNVYDPSGNLLQVKGSPETGLTNNENFAKYKISIGGEVAPCTDVTSHPEINGITCASGITVIGDLNPPTVPTNIFSKRFITSITLVWDASTDDVGVMEYLVKRNNILVGKSIIPTFTDANLTPFTNYNYTIQASDVAGNISPVGTVQARTLTKIIPPPPYSTWDFASYGLRDGTDLICIVNGPSALEFFKDVTTFIQGK